MNVLKEAAKAAKDFFTPVAIVVPAKKDAVWMLGLVVAGSLGLTAIDVNNQVSAGKSELLAYGLPKEKVAALDAPKTLGIFPAQTIVNIDSAKKAFIPKVRAQDSTRLAKLYPQAPAQVISSAVTSLRGLR